MMLVLEPLSGMIEVTANLSNAMLVAMMPYVSDAAKNLELPVPQPITQQQVVRCGITPYLDSRGEWGGFGVELQGGWGLGFCWGYLRHFQTTNSYYSLQDPDEIPRFVGPVRMTQAEAVQMARDTLNKLNIPLEKVFAEQEPRVTQPPKTRTGIVPRYRIEWLDPRASTSVDMEINADSKRVEQFLIAHNPNLRRPWPQIGVTPVLRSCPPRTNPEYARKLTPIVFQAVDDYGNKLGLPVPRPLATNHVARFSVEDNGGWPHCELELTNGWRFIYRNSMVNGYYAPDNLFDSDRRPILIKDFVGKQNITEAEAIKLIGRTLAKLNYPTNLVHMDFKPQIVKPALPSIPRHAFWWNLENEAHDDLVSKVEAEVDMEKGVLKSLYFDNKALWHHPPTIDVPLSLPSATNNSTKKVDNSSKPRVASKPSRPLTPFQPVSKGDASK
jgi:hypothetical protein